MKPLQSTPYGYKEFCRCLSDVPWKGDYAVANARRDIERARFGYGRKDWRSEPYAMTKQFLGAKRLRELLRLAHTGWGFQDCRELAAHFAWIWGRDAELSEDEIRDKLRELNAAFYQPISERELFYTARGERKELSIHQLSHPPSLRAGWIGGIFRRPALAGIQKPCRENTAA